MFRYYYSKHDVLAEALKVSLRDDDSDSESNTWMAEDAIGYRQDQVDKEKTFYCRRY